jgi:signal peptidase I
MDLRDVKEFLRDTFKYIVVFVAVLLLFIFVIGLQQVVGPSMTPNFNEGDVLVINKFINKFREPKREEVVVVSQSEKYMIKRVIGIPGDRIEFKDNKLYINDLEYMEDYLKDDVVTDDFKLSDIGVDVIPENKYLVLGDNRSNSLDSRNYGLIDRKQIIGTYWFRIWPLKR